MRLLTASAVIPDGGTDATRDPLTEVGSAVVADKNGMLMMTDTPGCAGHAETGVPLAVKRDTDTTDESKPRVGSVAERVGRNFPALRASAMEPEQGCGAFAAGALRRRAHDPQRDYSSLSADICISSE